MLFKFASYLLGTNTEQDDPHSTAAPPTSGSPPSNHQVQAHDRNNTNTSGPDRPLSDDSCTDTKGQSEAVSLARPASSTAQCVQSEADVQAELIYDEQFVQTEDRPERLEDSLHEDDEQWIYITPIRVCKSDERPAPTSNQDQDQHVSGDQHVPDQDEPLTESVLAESDMFNMFDLFTNNKPPCVPSHKKTPRNKLEESWVIHPPACFQVDNTFAIEQHPMENLYIEQPALSVINQAKRMANVTSVSNVSANGSTSAQSNNVNERNKENSKPIRRSVKCKNARKNRRLCKNKDKADKNKNAEINGNVNANEPSNNRSNDVNYIRNLIVDANNSLSTRRSSGRSRFSSNAHPVTCESALTPSVAFRRESVVVRPFALHRKLC